MQRIFFFLTTTIVALVMAAAAAGAGGRTSESYSFADPFWGSGDCPGFTNLISGHDRGFVTTWFDAAGEPIMQIGHIKAWETDVNSVTGKSISVNTDLLVHVDYAAGTTTITGARNIATYPGQGIVLQHVGRAVLDSNGQPVSLSGRYPEFLAGYVGEDFCAALA